MTSSFYRTSALFSFPFSTTLPATFFPSSSLSTISISTLFPWTEAFSLIPPTFSDNYSWWCEIFSFDASITSESFSFTCSELFWTASPLSDDFRAVDSCRVGCSNSYSSGLEVPDDIYLPSRFSNLLVLEGILTLSNAPISRNSSIVILPIYARSPAWSTLVLNTESPWTTGNVTGCRYPLR